jgi:AraC-like DNA-binding protein
MRTVEWLQNLYINEINLVNKYIAPKKDYPMKNSGRSHHGFLYTCKGSEIYHFHDRTIEALPDSILYIPKGEKYTIELRGEVSQVITVDFEPKTIDDVRPFCMKLGKNTALRPTFVNMETAWRKKEPDHFAVCKSELYKAIAAMIRHKVFYSSSANYNRIHDAVVYLHEHCLDRNFRIEELSRIAEMSPRYFEVLFSGEFRTSPKEYVTNLKLELAKELLLNEKNTVTSIAEQLGCSDIYHFSKIFKSRMGISPSEYRRRNANDRKK